MPRHYRYQQPAARDASRERYAEAHPEEIRPADPGDCREAWPLSTGYAGVQINWIMKPRRGNVRQWGAFTENNEPVLINGRHLIAGKDRIFREAAKLLPSYAGMDR